jgi:hypothetical protein
MRSQLDDTYFNWVTTVFVPLKTDDVQLSTVKDETVNGSRAEGILVKPKKHTPFKLYFDAKSHLLVMCEEILKREDSSSEIVVRWILSDFQDVQGTKQSMKYSILWDGVETSDGQVSNMKFYDKPMDAKLFEKP